MDSAKKSPDLNRPLVIDCSVAINLAATGCPSQIVRAIPQKLIAERTVQGELEIAKKRGYEHAFIFDALLAKGLLEIVEMGDDATLQFESLVIGEAGGTLDDGEAATIAYAAEHELVAVIDERKANRICCNRFPALAICSTVDLLALPSVEHALGKDQLCDAVIGALRNARMRVLPHCEKWVVDLIGGEAAMSSPSLSAGARTMARLLSEGR